MSRRRFYADPKLFSRDAKSVTLTSDEARHLREVLRLKRGDKVFVFDGSGREVECTIAEVRRDESLLDVVREIEPARPESPLHLTLGVALLKSDKFDLVVQKTTELGVAVIAPVTTKLADIRLRDESDATKRVARWQRIALEAAKQSGRAVVPEVLSPTPFETFLNQAEPARRLLFTERDGGSLLETKSQFSETSSRLCALVGPEGGWTDLELTTAKDHDWTLVTLGGRTLRAETAAIAITTLLQHLFGDLT